MDGVYARARTRFDEQLDELREKLTGLFASVRVWFEDTRTPEQRAADVAALAAWERAVSRQAEAEAAVAQAHRLAQRRARLRPLPTPRQAPRAAAARPTRRREPARARRRCDRRRALRRWEGVG